MRNVNELEGTEKQVAWAKFYINYEECKSKSLKVLFFGGSLFYIN